MQFFCKNLIITLLLVGGTACSTLKKSSDGLYHRFWHGYSRTDLKKIDFENRLNLEFLSLFPLLPPAGVISFLPVVPVRPTADDPAEWALVSYQSKDQYDQFKTSEAGKTYTDAHWKVFEKGVSASTVVEPYSGEALEGHAYELNPDFSDYSKSKVIFVLYQNKGSEDRVPEITDGIKKNHGASRRMLKNIIFTVTHDQIAEYLFFKADADVSDLLPSLNGDQVITLRLGEPGKDRIHEGQGLKAKL